eukprot:TRINITY_DN40272_c0_g1_i1.p3 TRINITY_DN40272_c0_g1~~TRINITY_DN40272_c0_g1_i1.p3  ORF type:complete len:103 (+),score=48.89 TRINITY_DN40272_c0_g1_i1:820-1128(+)
MSRADKGSKGYLTSAEVKGMFEGAQVEFCMETAGALYLSATLQPDHPLMADSIIDLGMNSPNVLDALYVTMFGQTGGAAVIQQQAVVEKGAEGSPKGTTNAL